MVTHRPNARLLVAAAAAGFALAGAAAPASAALELVGTTALADQRVTGKPPQRSERDLYVGDKVFFEERITTADNGRAQVLFVDESSVTLGPGSDLMIDKFVYDPDKSTGETVMSLGSGVVRFIGGQISRNNGVELSTPTATMGIRGSIVQVRSGQNDTTIDILKADRVNVTTPQGGNVVITEPGMRVTVGSDGQTSVRQMTSSEASGLTNDFGGSDGDDGENDEVSEQLESQSESELGGDQSTLESDPLDGGGTETADAGFGDDDSSAEEDAGVTEETEAGGDLEEDTGVAEETEVGGDVEDEDIVEEPVQLSPLQQAVNNIAFGRVLVTDTQFTDDFGTFIDDPAEDNYLGGRTGFIDVTSVDIDIAAGEATFANAQNSVTLPIQSGSFSIGQVDVTDIVDDGSSAIATGTGFLDPDGDFLFYDLHDIDNPQDRGFLFAGIPTPDGGNLPSSLRADTYQITPDSRFNSPVPGLDDTITELFPNANVSDVVLLRRQSGRIGNNSAGAARSRFLFGAIDIVGQGTNQRSFFHAAEGALSVTDNGNLTFGIGSRGSMRLGSEEQPIRITADYNPTPDSDGKAFFGPDLDYFVMTPQGPVVAGGTDDAVEFSSNAYVPFGNNSLSSPDINEFGFESFATTEVATRQGQRSDLIENRSTQTLNGFAAGLGESRLSNGTFPEPYPLLTVNGDPTNVRVQTQGSTNSVEVEFDLFNPAAATAGGDIETALLFFGGLNGTFRGSFVNDDVWAARNSTTQQGNFNGQPGAGNQFNPFGFRSAVIPNTLANDSDVLPSGVEFCSCEFAQWGYWMTAFRFGAESNDPGRREFVHLASWVAGKLPSLAEIPTTGGATYTGHIIGNVVDLSGNTPRQYIAAGTFQNQWDFSAASGSITITNFDGDDLTGNASAQNGRDYNGFVTTNDETRSGNIDGTFFSGGGDPVAETGGQFKFSGATTESVGTFAASKQSITVE